MRCHICDKALTDAEVQVTPDNKSYEPCAVCMDVIMDAAYSDGFVRPDEAEVVILEDPDHAEPDALQGELDLGWGQSSLLSD